MSAISSGDGAGVVNLRSRATANGWSSPGAASAVFPSEITGIQSCSQGTERMPMDYRTAGVDVAAGRAFVSGIRTSVESTRRPEVGSAAWGAFGGLCPLPSELWQQHPAGGPATRWGGHQSWNWAQAHGRHQMTVGIDHSGNVRERRDHQWRRASLLSSIYIATGKLSPEAMAGVVEGLPTLCRQSVAPLLGGGNGPQMPAGLLLPLAATTFWPASVWQSRWKPTP